MSKLAGSLLFWFTSTSGLNLSQQISDNQHGPRPGCSQCPKQVKDITCTRHNLTGFRFSWRSKREFSSPVVFGKISSLMMRLLSREAERLQSFPVLSLAVAALVPPFDNLSSKVLAVPLENSDVQLHGFLEQAPCKVGHHGCSGLAFRDLNWTRHAVEPRTGIEFPMMLVNILSGENKFNITSEVLVGTGSRTMKIIKIKSLKKLGPKYASIPADELNKCHDFYEDLLREDISMTVRPVINCNRMKINTVKEQILITIIIALKAFGSLFTKDIPIPAGTTVDFRRTADGKLITEIGGNQIGAVHSGDLCSKGFL